MKIYRSQVISPQKRYIWKHFLKTIKISKHFIRCAFSFSFESKRLDGSVICRMYTRGWVQYRQLRNATKHFIYYAVRAILVFVWFPANSYIQYENTSLSLFLQEKCTPVYKDKNDFFLVLSMWRHNVTPSLFSRFWIFV